MNPPVPGRGAPRRRPARAALLFGLALVTLAAAGEPLQLPGCVADAVARTRRRTPHARRRIARQLQRRALRKMAAEAHDAALGLLKRAQRMYPTDRTRFLMGRCHALAGRAEQARKQYDRLSAKFRRKLADNLRKRALGEMAQGQHGRAIDSLQLSVQLRDTPEARLLLAQSFELSGEPKRARDQYRHMLDTWNKLPDRAGVKRRLAAIERRLGGAEPPSAESMPVEPEPLPVSGDSRDAALLGEAESSDEALEGGGGGMLGLASDKLVLGGQILLRFNGSFTDGTSKRDQRLRMPNVLDLYADGRPNNRLRGFVRGRLRYDPSWVRDDQLDVSLVELWLKFDLARRVFFTVGQQLVRWGATRVWNPVDVINRSRRPVLDPFDDRLGLPMVKLHVPVESLSWNFYLLGMLDQVDTFDQAGMAGRGEFVFWTMELGLTGAYRDGTDPLVGLDLSAGIWRFDVTGELGVRITDDNDSGVSVRASGGLSYGIPIFDTDQLLLGGEYFYNQDGSADPDPGLLLTGQAQPFYLARHYGALFIALPQPGRLDDWSFTLTGIGSFNDLSFATQLLVEVKLHDYLSVQAIVTGHLGGPGELRIGDSAFPAAERDTYRAIYDPDRPGREIPNQLIDVQLWLRLEL